MMRKDLNYIHRKLYDSIFFFVKNTIKMSLSGNRKSVSERLDLLLLEILSVTEEYVKKKEEFIEAYRDVTLYYVID